ncbi:MAG TPA: NAD-dependent epimerase/dehydratase family protein [Xanthobacteraceae bacterium]|nr:NAD-dependent epimerase/dehydratase family protein [Xanthobacteraceae bacterium]
MRVLVTGGSGFFGCLLIERLAEGNAHIRNFDLAAAEDHPANVEFLRGDIRDAAAVRAACENIDYVIHSVAQQPLSKDPALMRSVNIEGTRNLLAAALDAKVKKVVFMSSTSIFGIPDELPIRRATPAKPVEAYGRTKVAAEEVCREFIARGLDVTLVRPRTILGHGRLGIFQMLFEWIREGSNVPVLGSGDAEFQFIHAQDLAEATILAAQRPGPAVYNIGTDRFGTTRQALEALCAHAATGSKVRSVPDAPTRLLMAATTSLGLSPLGNYHYLAYSKPSYFDISDAVNELGWKPKYSNDEMLIESYDWYLAHRDEVMRSKWASPHKSGVKQGVLKFMISWL